MDDLISRQVAIDEAEEWIETYSHGRGGQRERNLIKHVISGIKKLPSAQQWIPCSERLPEEEDYKPIADYYDGVVWYCTKSGEIGFGWYYTSTKKWANVYDCSPGEVVAWMPLPEPWKGEGK